MAGTAFTPLTAEGPEAWRAHHWPTALSPGRGSEPGGSAPKPVSSAAEPAQLANKEYGNSASKQTIYKSNTEIEKKEPHLKKLVQK